MGQKLLVTCLLIVTLASSRLGGVSTAGSAEPDELDLLWGQRITMRDGVRLNATVYRLKDQPRVPVVVSMTPYISDRFHDFATYFPGNGYVFVVVDARGRGNSEGEFHPFLQDAKDGYDVVEWLARQPWSNGKIAMFGGSYGGSNQWATAKELPPHLATIVPVAPGFVGVDFPGVNNIFRAYDVQWLALTSGHTGNWRIFGDQDFWSRKYLDLYRGKVAFKDFDRWVANPSEIFQRWVAHPHPDPYSDSITPTPEQYAALDLPILSITGHYDGDQPGTMAFYKRHMRHASEQARQNHYLIIGPWDHGGTRSPQKMVYGLEVGDKSLLDVQALHRDWYDWTMKDGERPEFLQDRVAYFVMATNEWKYASTLEEISKERLDLYLDARGIRSPSVFESGALTSEPPAESRPAVFVDDPLDTEKMAAIETARPPDYQNPEYVITQDDVVAIEQDGLVYHSAPLDEPLEISGFPRVSLWMSLDVPDTDFRVRLFEIVPNGDSILLSTDLLRARYRHSMREPQLVEPGAIERYDFNAMTFFSRLIGKGSRLRLVVDGNNSIAWQQNFNSGGVVAEETAADARTATVTVHQGGTYGSVLSLPIGVR